MTALRIGVIGVGHLGKEHARICCGLPGITLVGVADLNPVQAESVAQRCGSRAHTDYRALLDEIDAAVIAVPTAQHHAIASEVLSRGIPSLVEKPLAATEDQAEELVSISRKYGALLQVGHIERFNPAFEALLGRPLTPKYVCAERLGSYTGRSTDIGVVLDLMIHDIDLLLALVQSPLRRVEALGVSVFGGPEDMVTARLVFDDGCVAELRASRLAASPARRMHVWGPQGFASIDFARRHLTLVQPAAELRLHRNGQQPFSAATLSTMQQHLFTRHLQTLEINGAACDQLTLELQEFAECIRSGRRPRVGGEEACAAIAVATRILESIRVHA